MTRWTEYGAVLNQPTGSPEPHEVRIQYSAILARATTRITWCPTRPSAASSEFAEHQPERALPAARRGDAASSRCHPDPDPRAAHHASTASTGTLERRERRIRATGTAPFDFSTDTNNPNDANHPFANALLGNFKSYTESNNRPPLYENTTSLEWFVQDNWKVSPQTHARSRRALGLVAAVAQPAAAGSGLPAQPVGPEEGGPADAPGARQ